MQTASTSVIRAHAEQQFAEELDALAKTDDKPKPPNPRGKRHGPERRLTPRPAPSQAIWMVLGFFLLLALGQAVFFSMQAGSTISYSDFKAAVRAGRVQGVAP